jgi:hypothetical protein
MNMARPWSELRARVPAEVLERARKKTEAMLAAMAEAGCAEECEESDEAAVHDMQERDDDIQR